MKIVHTEVFTIDELSDKAKEKAREWYTEGLDYNWWEAVYEDARNIGNILGFFNMEINFSGFWSQGDGASFAATWSPPKAPVKAIKAECPRDEKLHAIARDVWEIVRKMTRDERADSWAITNRRGTHEGNMSCYREDLRATLPAGSTRTSTPSGTT